MRKIETIAVVICLLFAIAISLYHVSYEGFLGLSDNFWGSLWAISENGLSLTLSFLVGIYSYGILRNLFTWVFVPYFTVKLVYHFSCYSEVYFMGSDSWRFVWSLILVCLILFTLIYVLIRFRNGDN